MEKLIEVSEEKKRKLRDYSDQVMDVLEYIYYPEYVSQFDKKQVSEAIAAMTFQCWKYRVSPRTCALTIFGHTWAYQVARINPNETRH